MTNKVPGLGENRISWHAPSADGHFSPHQLDPDPDNGPTTESGVRRAMEHITQGKAKPIVIRPCHHCHSGCKRSNHEVRDGHHRLEAAHKLKLASVPVVFDDDDDDDDDDY